MLTEAVALKFWSNVLKQECWEWMAGKSNGYGKFNTGIKMVGAHRIAWELTNGRIPDGLFVCHKCDNKGCVNPAHLELGTAGSNTRDAIEKGLFPIGISHHNSKKTRCVHGHEYTPENTLKWSIKRRQCLECACKRLTTSGESKLRARQKKYLAGFVMLK